MASALVNATYGDGMQWRLEQTVAGLSACDDLNDDANSLFATDEFRMYCYKVLPCAKRQVHDWTTCCFAHPGEKARRRDPRVYKYLAIPCPEVKQNQPCPRGESCQYCHSVFEYWLHPSRYRTQLCQNGAKCKRGVCFFAHSVSDLRVPDHSHLNIPEELAAEADQQQADKAKQQQRSRAPGSPSTTTSGSLPPLNLPGSPPSPPTPGFSPIQCLPGSCTPVSRPSLDSNASLPPLGRAGSSGVQAAFNALFCSDHDPEVPEPKASPHSRISCSSNAELAGHSPPVSPVARMPSSSSAMLQQQQSCSSGSLDAAVAAAAAQLQSGLYIGTPNQQPPVSLSPASSLSRSGSSMGCSYQAGITSPPTAAFLTSCPAAAIAHPSCTLQPQQPFYPSLSAPLPAMEYQGNGMTNPEDLGMLLQALSMLQGSVGSGNSCYPQKSFPAEFGGQTGGAPNLQSVLQLAQLVDVLNKEPSLGNSEMLLGLVNKLLGMVNGLIQPPHGGYTA